MMAAPELLLFIVDRGRGDRLTSLCREEGIAFSLITHGRGVVGGHGGVDKDVVLLSVDSDRAEQAMRSLCSRIGGRKGSAAAVMLPFSALVAQQQTEALFTGGLKTEKKKERHEAQHRRELGEGSSKMSGKLDLIVIIVNRGFADEAVFAAKKEGARSSTVLSARGTGAQEQKRFFGAVIEPEKELVIMVAEREKRAAVMEAVGREAGLSTDAMGVCFSLPIDAAVGFDSPCELSEPQ